MLGVKLAKWQEQAILSKQLSNVKPLYERIDVKKIEEELEKLKNGQIEAR